MCTGCEACCNICPMQVIEMTEIDRRFRYPIISDDRYIQCGKCKSAYPILKEVPQFQIFQKKVYGAWSNDAETKFKNTCGGIFSEIARTVLAAGEVVAGSAYSSNAEIEYILMRDEDGLAQLRQSKYADRTRKGY